MVDSIALIHNSHYAFMSHFLSHGNMKLSFSIDSTTFSIHFPFPAPVSETKYSTSSERHEKASYKHKFQFSSEQIRFLMYRALCNDSVFPFLRLMFCMIPRAVFSSNCYHDSWWHCWGVKRGKETSTR